MPVTPIPAAIAPSGIKSIQRGTITIGGVNLTATATITAVNTLKAQIELTGCVPGALNLGFLAYLEMPDSTTVRATRKTQDGSTESILSFQVTEWY